MKQYKQHDDSRRQAATRLEWWWGKNKARHGWDSIRLCEANSAQVAIMTARRAVVVAELDRVYPCIKQFAVLVKAAYWQTCGIRVRTCADGFIRTQAENIEVAHLHDLSTRVHGGDLILENRGQIIARLDSKADVAKQYLGAIASR